MTRVVLLRDKPWRIGLNRLRLVRIPLAAALAALCAYAGAVAWTHFEGRGEAVEVASAELPEGAAPADASLANPALEQISPETPLNAAADAVPEIATAGRRQDDPLSLENVGIVGEAPLLEIGAGPEATAAVEVQVPAAAAHFAATALTGLPTKLWAQTDRLLSASEQVAQTSIDGVEGTVEGLAAFGEAAAQFEPPVQVAEAEAPKAVEPEVTVAAQPLPPVAAAAALPQTPPDGVVLLNPADSGGPIHYLVDDAAYSLHPGQEHRLDAESFQRIQFHQGDDFGNVAYAVDNGVYVFHVTDRGWNLYRQAKR